jgi:hypothetical protein
LLQIDYALRYYLHLNPDGLTDEEWAIAINALQYIRRQEAKDKIKN